MDQVVIYSHGIIACSVCASSDLSRVQIEEAVNSMNPTGISTLWAISKNSTFAQGGPQPGPCEQNSTRTHYLMEC